METSKPRNRHYTPENSLQHGWRTVRCLLMCDARSLSLGVWWADRAAYRGKHLHSRGRSRGTRTRNRWTSGTWRTTNTPCLSTRHPTWRLFLSSSARAAAASRPFGGTERRRAVGFPLARVSWRATWRRHRPCSRRSIPHHTPKARDDRRARGWECSASATRRTRPRSTHPHPRSATPPFWFSAGAERRHHRRARTTTHTTPSSRRVAYLARRSRDPRSARCSAHLTPRTGGRGDRACAAAPPLQAFFRDVSEQNDVES